MSEGKNIFEATATATVADRVCLMGNVDPMDLLMNGTPEEVAAQTKRIKDGVSRQGGHLFNTDEGVLRDTPVENLRAVIRAIREE